MRTATSETVSEMMVKPIWALDFLADLGRCEPFGESAEEHFDFRRIRLSVGFYHSMAHLEGGSELYIREFHIDYQKL